MRSLLVWMSLSLLGNCGQLANHCRGYPRKGCKRWGGAPPGRMALFGCSQDQAIMNRQVSAMKARYESAGRG